MKILRTLSVLTALALPVLAIGCSHEQDQSDEPRATRTSSGGERRVATRDTDRDGTDDTVTVRDGDDGSQLTAMDQSESAEDLEITRQIRASVVGDSSLSFGARNCVIITRGGVVTLRGDVTGDESQAIERHAQQAAGVLRVDNNLNVTDQASAR
ncbi:MAG: BON domain-containing protein [Deltaproteobacteria bacterium]|nr:BON domain-containing protein [Deltaproteobacteria bacterium]